MRRFRSRSSRSRGTTKRWVGIAHGAAGLFNLTSGSPAGEDITPGAPSQHWLGGTAEPTLLRIRGWWYPIITAVSIAPETDNGVVSHFITQLLIYFAGSESVLGPTAAIDYTSEDVIFADTYVEQHRVYISPQTGNVSTGGHTDIQNLAALGNLSRTIDSKAKRRVRSERNRLMVSAQSYVVRQTTAGGTVAQEAGASGRIMMGLRCLYETSR